LDDLAKVFIGDRLVLIAPAIAEPRLDGIEEIHRASPLSQTSEPSAGRFYFFSSAFFKRLSVAYLGCGAVQKRHMMPV
jgi:hypothetical protein